MARVNPYDPSDRSLKVEYAISTSGDRWFIPVNSEDTKANQVAQCNKLVGKDNAGTPADVGSGVVPT